MRFEPAGANIACHDTGVILGKVLRAACAGGQGFAVWSLDRRDGGSLIDPELLYIKNMKTELGLNINTGHSAAFSNDGDTLIFGHEPNGGTSARCQPTGTVLGNATYPVQTDDMKSFFFFATDTGELKGKWTLPRDQTEFENCTLHNYNVVPTRKRDILVHGSYQSGIGVLDFSDPANAKEIAYADPEPITPGVFTHRRRLVLALLQRADLRVRHHARPAHVDGPRPPRDPGDAAPAAQPADAGVHDEAGPGLVAGRTLILLALLAVLPGCGGEGAADAPAPRLAVPWVDPDGELPVVGSLAVNPADDVLWMSTNTGLTGCATARGPSASAGACETPDGAGTVSEQLVVAFDGPDTLLASGHPAAEETALPSVLGLIRSEDAGRTWAPISEQGTADFHALRRSGDLLAGALYGQSQVLASRDGGRTWEDRAAPRVLVDLAVDPGGPAAGSPRRRTACG